MQNLDWQTYAQNERVGLIKENHGHLGFFYVISIKFNNEHLNFCKV